jgi:murein DD-endopeptidase MepM/ murein hydrolase activator NlpD
MKKRLFFIQRIISSFFNNLFFSTKPKRSFGLLCALTVIFISYHYISFSQTDPKIEQFENKITNPNAGIDNRDQPNKSFHTKINSLWPKLDELSQLVDKIRNIAGIGDRTAETGRLGIGGSYVKDLKTSLAESSAYDQWAKNLNDEVNKLNDKTVNQFDEYQVLLETVKEIKRIQDATPSICPLEDGQIASNFGYRLSPFTGKKEFHSGLDISDHRGAPVKATAEGIIVSAGYNGDLGKCVIIDHGFGIVTEYGHLSEVKVKSGQQVKRGDIIGKVGNTGRSTGPHLHYEVRLNNTPINPVKYMPAYLASKDLAR